MKYITTNVYNIYATGWSKQDNFTLCSSGAYAQHPFALRQYNYKGFACISLVNNGLIYRTKNGIMRLHFNGNVKYSVSNYNLQINICFEIMAVENNTGGAKMAVNS